MKKLLKYALLSFLFIFILCFTDKVYAVQYRNPEDYLCSNKNINALISKINKVKATYEFVNDKDKGRHFKVKVMNLSDNLILSALNLEYTYEQNGDTFYLYSFIGPEGGTVELKFYGGLKHPCAEQYISKKRLVIPKYNIYSELDACVEYEEFPLCGMYYDGEILNEEDFNNRLNAWIEENKTEYEKIEVSFFDRIKEFIEDNQLLIAIIITIIVITIVALIISAILRRAKRTKIKF